MVGAIGLFQYRLKIMDFLHGFLEGTVVLVIPNPQLLTQNIDAIIKPFQPWVFMLHNEIKINNLKRLISMCRFGSACFVSSLPLS